MMKKILGAFVLMFAIPFAASAAVVITNVEVPEVEPGQTVNVDIEVVRSGAPANPIADALNPTNDWQSFAWRVESDIFICVNTPNFTTGNGTSTSSFSFNATSTEGEYDLDVRVYAFNNCFGLQDSENGADNHDVVVPLPPPTPSTPDEEVEEEGSGGHSFLTACYYMLKIGAQWCDNSNPILRSLWAIPEVREALQQAYVRSL